ncbi:MAG: sensor histidine kinase [Saprospiraceae bacterium]
MRIIILSLFFIPLLLGNNPPNFSVEYELLTLKEGLAANEIFCTLKDARGYLWIGTNNGLNRYDGQEFLHFSLEKNGLHGNKIINLTLSENDEIIITYGMRSFELLADSVFQSINPYTFEISNLLYILPGSSIPSSKVLWIQKEDQQEIWHCITKQPLQYLKLGKDGIRKSRTFTGKKPTDLEILNSSFSDIGSLISFRQHLYIDKEGIDTLLPKQQFNFLYSNLSLNEIYLEKDHLNYRWKFSAGQWVIEPINRESNFGDFIGLPAYGKSINSKEFFFNSPTNGLNYFNESLSYKIFGPEQQLEFGGFRFNQIRKDGTSIFWISTSIGLLKIKIKPIFFHHQYTRETQNDLLLNQCRGLIEFPLGSKNIYANFWNKLLLFEKDKPAKIIYSVENILFPMATLDSTIYIASDRIIEIDPFSQKVLAETNTFGEEIWSIASKGNKTLLIGSRSSIAEYDLETRQFNPLKSEISTTYPFIPYRFIPLSSGETLIVAENGLFLINLQQLIIPIWEKQNTVIYDLIEVAEEGWFAASNKGLLKFDSDWENWRIENPEILGSKEIGWPTSVLYRIEKDALGFLWISSNRGLIRYQPSSKESTFYDLDDGLIETEFNRISSLNVNDSLIIFGSINGFTNFNPFDFEIKSQQVETFPLVVNAITIRNKKGQIREGQLSQKIIFEPNDQSLNIDFRLLNYTKDQKNYTYRIGNVESVWNNLSSNNIRLFQLPYGNQIIEIKASHPTGKWRDVIMKVPITVIKPFHKKTENQLAFGLAILVVFISIFRFRTYSLKKRNESLNHLINLKTHDLKIALKDKDLLLKEIHHRVKNNLQIISGLLHLQKKSIIDEIGQRALIEGQSRINSIALIHQNLYENEQLATIHFGQFFQDLIFQIKDLFANEKKTLAITGGNLNWHFDVDTAVPLSIILNELLTNSYKHSLPDTKEVSVHVTITKTEEDTFLLIYQDNGPGLKEGIDFNKVKSLGLKLIKGLAKQLGGKARYEYRNGGYFCINFKEISIKRT